MKIPSFVLGSVRRYLAEHPREVIGIGFTVLFDTVRWSFPLLSQPVPPDVRIVARALRGSGGLLLIAETEAVPIYSTAA